MFRYGHVLKKIKGLLFEINSLLNGFSQPIIAKLKRTKFENSCQALAFPKKNSHVFLE